MTRVAHQWLNAHANDMLAGGDAVLKEAVEIVRHDAWLIGVKLHRALHGRDRYEHDGDGDDHPVQNDWNGSAKVALISMERSAAAWQAIATTAGDNTPARLADQLVDLRREVEAVFPNAWVFVRPGFDEPGR